MDEIVNLATLKWYGQYCEALSGKHVTTIPEKNYNDYTPTKGHEGGWLEATEGGWLTGEWLGGDDLSYSHKYGFGRWDAEIDEMIDCDQSEGFIIVDPSDDFETD